VRYKCDSSAIRVRGSDTTDEGARELEAWGEGEGTSERERERENDRKSYFSDRAINTPHGQVKAFTLFYFFSLLFLLFYIPPS
jgi:hypothetical protein